MNLKLFLWRCLALCRQFWARLPFALRVWLNRPADCLRYWLLPQWHYAQWLGRAEPQPSDRGPMRRHLQGLRAPTIGLVMQPLPADQSPTEARHAWLRQLWFEPDFVTRRDPGQTLGECLSTAANNCDYLCVLNEGEQLPPWALYYLKQALAASAGLAVLYSDEDQVDASGERAEPRFAGGFDRFRFHALQRLPGLVLVRARAIRAGDLQSEPSWGTVVAAVVQRTPDDGIKRIEMVLLSRTAAAASAARVAARVSLPAGYQRHWGPGVWAVRPPAPSPWPKVAIIVPTRDATAHVRRCLHSIENHGSYPEREVVLVDNQSRDPEALGYFDELECSGRVQRLTYDAPFNFSAICNTAARVVSAEYLLFLNNDTEILTPDWLHTMVAFAAQDEVGCVGAKLLYPDGRVQHAGLIMGLRGIVGYPHQGERGDAAGYDDRLIVPRRVSAVTAACLMVRRELFEAVGGMNENDLPVAFNDVDLCLRIEQLGKQNVWLPDVKLLHHESATRGSDRGWRQAQRFLGEANYMRRAWKTVGYPDHAYNRNLSLDSESFALNPWPEPYRPWETIVDN